MCLTFPHTRQFSKTMYIQQHCVAPLHRINCAQLNKPGRSYTETEGLQTAGKLYDNYACSSGIQRGRRAFLKFSCTSDEHTSPLLHCRENDRFEDVCGRWWKGKKFQTPLSLKFRSEKVRSVRFVWRERKKTGTKKERRHRVEWGGRDGDRMCMSLCRWMSSLKLPL